MIKDNDSKKERKKQHILNKLEKSFTTFEWGLDMCSSSKGEIHFHCATIFSSGSLVWLAFYTFPVDFTKIT